MDRFRTAKEQDVDAVIAMIRDYYAEDGYPFVKLFLQKCVKQHKKDTEVIDNAIKLIRDSKGKYTVEELCDKLNIHYKQLERKFLNTIGTTPKVFSRTTRFLHLCHHLKKKTT